MSISASIVWGVVSGILTSALLFAATRAFRHVILPWYQALVYHEIIVSGEWNVTPLQTMQTAKMNLTQHANRLSGSCVFISSVDGRGDHEKLRTFTLTGNVSDRIVELSFRHTDRNRIGAGVFLLEVVGDGRRMEGVQSMYNVSGGGVTWAHVLVTRPDVISLLPAQLELPVPPEKSPEGDVALESD